MQSNPDPIIAGILSKPLGFDYTYYVAGVDMVRSITFFRSEYKREGKLYLTIAFGCTGGKHRSVFMAEKLCDLLKDNKYNVNLLHRELPL